MHCARFPSLFLRVAAGRTCATLLQRAPLPARASLASLGSGNWPRGAVDGPFSRSFSDGRGHQRRAEEEKGEGNRELCDATNVSDLHDQDAIKGQSLHLPAPPDERPHATVLDVSGGGTTIKLDGLGPLVVNEDGSLARISNWAQMTTHERETTLRVVGKRNQLRLGRLKEREKQQLEKYQLEKQ